LPGACASWREGNWVWSCALLRGGCSRSRPADETGQEHVWVYRLRVPEGPPRLCCNPSRSSGGGLVHRGRRDSKLDSGGAGSAFRGARVLLDLEAGFRAVNRKRPQCFDLGGGRGCCGRRQPAAAVKMLRWSRHKQRSVKANQDATPSCVPDIGLAFLKTPSLMAEPKSGSVDGKKKSCRCASDGGFHLSVPPKIYGRASTAFGIYGPLGPGTQTQRQGKTSGGIHDQPAPTTVFGLERRFIMSPKI